MGAQLCLAALNSSKSAHGAINLLGGRFFDSYHFTSTQSRNLGLSVEELKFQCRLHTKVGLLCYPDEKVLLINSQGITFCIPATLLRLQRQGYSD